LARTVHVADMGLGQSHESLHILGGLFHRERHGTSVHEPKEELRSQVWYGVGQPNFIFPELQSVPHGVPHLQDKANLAICLSGGSMRACVCSLGYVRALKLLGVLDRARYLNANSGSAWFTAAFAFQEKVPTDVFLGEYVPPEELTLEKARSTLQEGSFGNVVANANGMIGRLVKDLAVENILLDPWLPEGSQLEFRAWEDAVGGAFLEPYGLADADAAFALHGKTKFAEASGAWKVHTACREQGMPYPIMTACVVDARLCPAKCPFVSFEFTPWYSGVPARLEDEQTKWGGVLVESFACSSDPPVASARDEDGTTTASLKVKWVPPLPQASGISSQFLAMVVDAQKSRLWDCVGCPELYLFDGADHTGIKAKMTDGGGSDNCAIYPALRRGVKKLIVCTALAVEVCDDWAEQEFDISGYFGAYPEGKSFKYSDLSVSAEAWNRSAQVFERHEWDSLFGTLRQCIAEGQPQVIRRRLSVLKNAEQGIAGGYKVDTIWVFNGKPAHWWDYLPDSCKAFIDQKIDNFPRVNTYIVDWDPETVSFVSNLCAWQILEAVEMFKDLLAGSDEIHCFTTLCECLRRGRHT